jgi:hypothetical protein
MDYNKSSTTFQKRKTHCLKIMSKYNLDPEILVEVLDSKKTIQMEKAINKILPERIRDKIVRQYNKIYDGSLGHTIYKK